MTSYDFGGVVLVPLPFTNQSGSKKRPAIVVSSAAYNSGRLDIILMAVLATVEKSLVLRRLGRLEQADRDALRQALQVILG